MRKKHLFSIVFILFSLNYWVSAQHGSVENILYDTSYIQSRSNAMWCMYGGGIGKCPTVYFANDDAIATYFPEKNTIRIGNWTRQKLASFGWSADDCLFVIIGHELYHAIRKEKSANYGDSVVNPWEKQHEIDADLFGLLAAHLAGYSAGIKNYDTMLEALGLRDSGKYPRLRATKIK